jgi:predicted RNase H-like nuclease (RuvC/YqgF family)
MPTMTKLDLGEKVEVLITKLTVMEEKIDHLTTDLKEANRKIEELDTSMKYAKGGLKVLVVIGVVVSILVGFTKLLGVIK